MAELTEEGGVGFPPRTTALQLRFAAPPAAHDVRGLGGGIGGHTPRDEQHVCRRSHATGAHAVEVTHRSVATVETVVLRVAVAAVSASIFVLLTLASRTVPHGWERSLVRTTAGLPDALEPLMWIVMQAGTRAVVALAALSLVLARRLRAAAVAGGAGASAWLIAIWTKESVARPRPTAAAVGLPLRHHVEGFGFPSSHAAIAAALAVALVITLRPGAWLSAAAIAMAIGVAVARVYFGVHWPLDVGGGLALGAFAGAILAMAIPR